MLNGDFYGAILLTVQKKESYSGLTRGEGGQINKNPNVSFREPSCWLIVSKWGPCSAMANVFDCDIIVNDFKLQLCYYVHFQTNTIVERHEPPYPTLVMG